MFSYQAAITTTTTSATEKNEGGGVCCTRLTPSTSSSSSTIATTPFSICSTTTEEEEAYYYNSNIDIEKKKKIEKYSYKRRINPSLLLQNHLNQSSESSSSSDIEALKAKELNELSIEDRERIFEEINGISTIINETTETISKSLYELQIHINNIKGEQRIAYDIVKKKKPYYVNDIQFRLMFLRAEYFHTRKAAKRIIKHFDSKRKLFGDILLLKERITYNDLNDDDKKAMLNGSIQISHCKDQTGRIVVFCPYKLWDLSDLVWQNQYRNCWYQVMSALQDDINAQRKGLVIVGYHIGLSTINPHVVNTLSNILMLNEGLPYRITGLHFCYDLPKLRPLMLIMQSAIGKDHRLHFRSHYGSDVECQYKLMTFGIPQRLLNVDSHGQLKRKMFIDGIEKRKALDISYYNNHNNNTNTNTNNNIELSHTNNNNNNSTTTNNNKNNATNKKEPSSTTTTTTTTSSSSSSSKKKSTSSSNKNKKKTAISSSSSSSPTTNTTSTTTSSTTTILLCNNNTTNVTTKDVLLEKGGCRQKHPGNAKLSELIELNRFQYQNSKSKIEKSNISMSIVKTIKHNGGGGRFLKRRNKKNNEWIEINDKEARDAISHRLRNKAPRRRHTTTIEYVLKQQNSSLSTEESSSSTTETDFYFQRQPATSTSTTTTSTTCDIVPSFDDGSKSRKRVKKTAS